MSNGASDSSRAPVQIDGMRRDDAYIESLETEVARLREEAAMHKRHADMFERSMSEWQDAWMEFREALHRIATYEMGNPEVTVGELRGIAAYALTKKEQ